MPFQPIRNYKKNCNSHHLVYNRWLYKTNTITNYLISKCIRVVQCQSGRIDLRVLVFAFFQQRSLFNDRPGFKNIYLRLTRCYQPVDKLVRLKQHDITMIRVRLRIYKRKSNRAPTTANSNNQTKNKIKNLLKAKSLK